MSERTPKERQEIFRDVIWALTGVSPDESVTELQNPKLTWEYQGRIAEFVFTEHPYVNIWNSNTEVGASMGAFTKYFENQSNEEILRDLKLFKMI